MCRHPRRLDALAASSRTGPRNRGRPRVGSCSRLSDPAWGLVALPGAEIEINVGGESPLDSFALHIRVSDSGAADEFVARLLDRLGVRAFDPEGAEGSGIFGNG